MKLTNGKDLLLLSLKDLYSAETQIIEALPAMIEAANDPTLKEGLEKHLAETEGQIDRLTQIANILEVELDGEKCLGMEGVIKEGKEMLKLEGDPNLLDLALISAARRVEHYEMAGYLSAIDLADELDLDEVKDLLKETLAEEESADETLAEAGEDLSDDLEDED